MKNRTMLAILTVASLALSPAFAYLSGWASDRHCTAEEEGLGECDRHNDGANNTFAWLRLASIILSVAMALGAFIQAIYWLIYLFSRPSAGGYGGETIADWMARERGT